MSESYCMKSCSECGICSGCRTKVYSDRCEIARCCREKDFSSCGSCENAHSCETRRCRDMMPQACHEDQRNSSALQRVREKASLLEKGTRLIFWLTIVNVVVNLVQAIPAMKSAFTLLDFTVTAAILYGYFRMKEVHPGFATVAGLQVAVLVIDVAGTLLMGESGAGLLGIVTLVCAILTLRFRCFAFAEALEDISKDMSAKWISQWTVYLMSMCCFAGGLVVLLIPVIRFVGILAILAGAGMLFFVTIREIVYLRQTEQVCGNFVYFG